MRTMPDRSTASYMAHGPRTQAIFVALMIGCSWCAATESVLPPQTPAELARKAKNGVQGACS